MLMTLSLHLSHRLKWTQGLQTFATLISGVIGAIVGILIGVYCLYPVV
jgi:ABC-type dipeptide/oligopeptide/nickel transport system permease component